MQGAKNISEYELAKAFLKHVKGLDDESICCAHKLVEFDVYYRAQMSSFYRSMQKEKSPVWPAPQKLDRKKSNDWGVFVWN